MPCDFVIYKLHEFQMHFVHCTELVIRTRLILRPLVKPSKVTFDADHPFAVGILSVKCSFVSGSPVEPVNVFYFYRVLDFTGYMRI